MGLKHCPYCPVDKLAPIFFLKYIEVEYPNKYAVFYFLSVILE